MVLKSTLIPESIGVVGILTSLLLCYLIYSLSIAVYNLTFHPLAKYPGPLLRGAFYFPLYYEIWTGDLTFNSQALHDKYGEVVRTSPSSLSYNTAEAWQDIYGQRHGKKMVPKDPHVYLRLDPTPDIILSNDADHARIRRTLAHAFSEAALSEQESLQTIYFNLLISKLTQKAASLPTKTSSTKASSPTSTNSPPPPVNMVRWFNFATFDLIGDLSFGESFDALESGEYHSWIENIVSGFKFARLFRLFAFYPVLGVPFFLGLKLWPGIEGAWKRHEAYTREKSEKRMSAETGRKDLMSYILRHNDDRGMTHEEIIKTSSTLIIAGSETTATMLSGCLYHLLRNPSVLQTLTDELRSTFKTAEDITFVKLQGCKYLAACLQEAFRIYPPVPMVLPRRTVEGGMVVCGRFVPEDVSLGVHQWSAYHSSTNFLDHKKYIPERWLGDPKYADDKRAVLQPFSVGPRNCLGRHLAMAQMRSILARVIWNFDITLCKESENWVPQKVFLLWDKPDLMVNLVKRSPNTV